MKSISCAIYIGEKRGSVVKVHKNFYKWVLYFSVKVFEGGLTKRKKSVIL